MNTTIANAISSASSSQQTAGSAILGKDDFLKMLTMQMRYQDPMNPMDGTQFASQLAQFSSVEQLSNINTNLLQSIDANALLTKSISNALATTFIGKEVRAVTDNFKYGGETNAKLGYSLGAEAETVTVKILDSSGAVVRTIEGTGTAIGDNNFEWDGKDDKGKDVNKGEYSFSVEAKSKDGAVLPSQSYVFGLVEAIRFKADGTVFVIDGTEVSLSNILEIMQG